MPNRTEVQPAEYVDVQKGNPLIAVLAATSLATLAWTWIVGPHIAATLLLLLQVGSLLCFCTLLIRVKDGYLTWQFGPGWVHGRVALSEIVSTYIVMSPFAYGWGIRHTAQGWRFHRSGSLAIEIHFRGGKRLRLGTSRAHELQHVLESACGDRHRFQ